MTAAGLLAGILTFVFVLFLIGWLSSMLMILKPQQSIMVMSWVGGKVLRTITEPGLYLKAPWPIQSASQKVSLAERMIPQTIRARSKEEAFFNLQANAVMIVDRTKVPEAIFNMENPVSQIRAKMAEAMKRVVPTLELSEIYADREQISNEIKGTLNLAFQRNGWECLEVIVDDPELESSIEEASNKRLENRRRAEAAEDLRDAIITERTADAQAEADSLRLRVKAAGDAKKEYSQKLAEAVAEFRKTVPEIDPASLLAMYEGIDRRDAIVSASSNPGSLILMDTKGDSDFPSKQLGALLAANRQQGDARDSGTPNNKVQSDRQAPTVTGE